VYSVVRLLTIALLQPFFAERSATTDSSCSELRNLVLVDSRKLVLRLTRTRLRLDVMCPPARCPVFEAPETLPKKPILRWFLVDSRSPNVTNYCS
jgi:hypothetical protein